MLQRVELEENRAPFALMLGGPDRRTFHLHSRVAQADGHVANLDACPTGPAPGRSWPCRSRYPAPAGRDEGGGPSRCFGGRDASALTPASAALA